MLLSGDVLSRSDSNLEPGERVAKFSIVVPAYNAEATLPETLDAVLAQRYDDWECVVVDDGSSDCTLAVAREYASKDARVRVLTQSNRGTAGAYNTGVTEARGDWVVLCSADDLLLPDHLSTLSQFVDTHSACDVLSSNGYFLLPDDSRELVYRPGDLDDLSFIRVIGGCFYSVGATYRRSLFEMVGGYRVGIFGEDYDFWLRAMSLGARHCYVPLPLSLHRLSATQKSSDAEAVLISDIRILRDLESSGGLSRRERAAIHDSILSRRVRAARLDGPSAKRAVRVALVYLGQPASLFRAIPRSLRRRLQHSPQGRP